MLPHNQRDRPVGGLVFVLSLFLWQGDAQHQGNAHGQRHGDLEGGDAVCQRQRVVALNEVVGAVIDARTGHQRKDAGEQEHRHPELRTESGLDTVNYKFYNNSVL